LTDKGLHVIGFQERFGGQAFGFGRKITAAADMTV
jgi:hypothetical protein